MQTFNTFEELEAALPEVAILLVKENQMQYPNAKFVGAAKGGYYRMPEDEDQDDDLIALFDVDLPNEMLYCWVTWLQDPYIDDYMLMDTDTAKKELKQVE